jgi:hypothetical protein
VTEWYQREVASIIDVFVGIEKISCSTEHPFWVDGKGWVLAFQLKRGMHLRTRDGALLTIDEVHRRDEVTQVYNVEIDGFHTYFVSGLEILSHNMCGGDISDRPALPPGRTTDELRNTPGVPEGGQNLPIVTNRWLKGTDGNLGLVPRQVAQSLSGRLFRNFGDFREEFWKAVASDANLSSQFTRSNLKRMAKGRAPIAPRRQHFGSFQSYVLHHKTPIQRGGKVYNLDNIIVVTPRMHQDILSRKFHFGN